MKKNMKEMMEKIIDSNPFTFFTIRAVMEKIEDTKLNKELKKEWKNKTGIYSYLK